MWQRLSAWGLWDPLNRNWATVFGGTAVRLALGFLAGVLIVRALGPADYGVYALFAAVIGIGSALLDFGLATTAVKTVAANHITDPAQAREQLRLFFWLRLLLAGGCICLGILLTPWLTAWLGIEAYPFLFVVALVSIGTTILNGSFNAFLQALGQFGALARVLVLSSGMTLLATLLLALTGRLNLWTAILVGMLVSLFGAWLAWRGLPLAWRQPGAFRPPPWTRLKAKGGPFLRYGRWLWAGNLLAVLAAYLDIFLLNRWLAATAVGLYALALNLAGKAEIANHSLRTVLLPTASQLNNKNDVRRYLRRGLTRGLGIGLLLLLLLPLAYGLIPLIYGQPFAAAAPLFAVLVGIVIFDTLLLPATLLMYAFDRPQLSAAAGLTYVSLFWLLGNGWIPHWGVVGAVGARACARLLSTAVILPLLVVDYRRLPEKGGVPSTSPS